MQLELKENVRRETKIKAVLCSDITGFLCPEAGGSLCPLVLGLSDDLVRISWSGEFLWPELCPDLPPK